MKKLTSIAAICAILLNLATQAYGLGLTDPWWLQGGNFTGSTQNLGTSDNFDLPIITNNTESARFVAGPLKLFGVGTAVPASAFHVAADPGTFGSSSPATVVTISRNISGGSPSTGFGSSIRFLAEDSTTDDQDQTGITSFWTTVTHATRTSAMAFFTVNSGAAIAEVARFTGTGSFLVGAAGVPTFTVAANGDITLLHGVVTSFPAANATGVLHNNGAGTYSIVADGGAPGGGLPSGTANQTLRNVAGTSWAASSVLTNDGTNLTSTGFLTWAAALGTGQIHIKGPTDQPLRVHVGSVIQPDFFFATTGTGIGGAGPTDIVFMNQSAELRLTAGGAAMTVSVEGLSNHDDSNTWVIDGTSPFLALGSAFAIRWSNATTLPGTPDIGLARHAAGILRVTDGTTGVGDIRFKNMVGLGPTHKLGTAGVTTTLSVGQGAAGADDARLEVLAGSGGGRAELDLSNGSTTLVRLFSAGTNTSFEYAGLLSLISGPAGPTRVSIAASGETTILSGPARQLTFNNAGGGRSSFVDSSHAANVDYTLPTAQGAASSVLGNDGSGNLSWAAVGGTGGGLPAGSANQTLRHNGSVWVASSVLQNDGTNVTDTGTLTVQGASIAGGTSTVSFAATFGQGGVGASTASITGNAGSTGIATLALQQNGTTRLFLDNGGGLGSGRIAFPLGLNFLETTGGNNTIGILLSTGTVGATLTVGQGTTGTDVGKVVARAGNSGSTAPVMALNRNGTDIAQWTTDGTNGFFDYPGTLSFRAGIAGTAVVTFSSTGNVTAIGSTHAFGTAGTATTLTVGQGAGGSENATARIQSASSGTPALVFGRSASDLAQLLVSGPDMMFDYPGTLNFRTGIGGTVEASITNDGSFTAAGPLHMLGSPSIATTLEVGQGAGNSTNISTIVLNGGPSSTNKIKIQQNGSDTAYFDNGGALTTTRIGYNIALNMAAIATNNTTSQFLAQGTLGQLLTVGQGTTGTDAGQLIVRSGNSGTTSPNIRLGRNNTQFAQWAYDGTNTFFDYTGALNFRAGIAGTSEVQFSATGGITAIGDTHVLGTAGTATALTVGQGTTGADAATLRVQSGNTTTTAPTINLDRNGTDVARWTFDGANVFFDYSGTTGDLRFRSTVGGTAKFILNTNGVISTYNNVAKDTNHNGTPFTIASATITAQTANKAATNLVTSSTAGRYRLSCYVTVTTQATTSSTVPNCNLICTDPTDSVAKTIQVSPAFSLAAVTGVYTATGTANASTAVGLSGAATCDSKGATAIQYSTANYASVGGTAMQYKLYAVLEAF